MRFDKDHLVIVESLETELECITAVDFLEEENERHEDAIITCKERTAEYRTWGHEIGCPKEVWEHCRGMMLFYRSAILRHRRDIKSTSHKIVRILLRKERLWPQQKNGNIP